MSTRRRRSTLRQVAMRMGVAGAAVLASAFTLAPAAVADDATQPDTTTEPSTTTDPTDTHETPSDEAKDPADTETDSDTPKVTDRTTGSEEKAVPKQLAARAAAEVEPDFGFNKFRVGVQIADGSYVPAGTTTLGSQITITEAGPGVPGGTQTQTCTTTLVSSTDPTTTFCEDFNTGAPFEDTYIPTYEDTVTITQTTVNDGLVITDGTKVDVPSCDPSAEESSCIYNGGDILLTDAGLPPKAADDSTCVDPGAPVSIDVLANDDTVNGAPLTDLEVTSDPSLGSAAITGSGDDRKVRYTPSGGFDDSDAFAYRLSTPNGTASATVDITACPEPTGVLPDTGGGDPRMLGYGALLVAGGGALIASGRRRREEAPVA